MNPTNLLPLTLFIFLCSCASTYKPINPRGLHYSSSGTTDSIDFNYQYDVLLKSGNKKYTKREHKIDVRVVALKITNNTTRSINPANDLDFYGGNNRLEIMSPAIIKQELKQRTPIYLLYLLFTPMNFGREELRDGIVTRTTTVPVGLVIGPGLTAYNMATAGAANKKFEAELNEYSIDKTIRPGQTLYALIGFRTRNYDPLTIRVLTK